MGLSGVSPALPAERVAVELLERQADSGDRELIDADLRRRPNPTWPADVTTSSWSTPSPLTPKPPTNCDGSLLVYNGVLPGKKTIPF